MNIQEQYPHMFVPRFWGMDIGDGWMPIVEEAIVRIAALPDPPQIVQVKEKFGLLRIYTSCVHAEADRIIREAEAKCAETCEYCGLPGEARSDGWIKTLCSACNLKRSNR